LLPDGSLSPEGASVRSGGWSRAAAVSGGSPSTAVLSSNLFSRVPLISPLLSLSPKVFDGTAVSVASSSPQVNIQPSSPIDEDPRECSVELRGGKL
ncbi:hypothetical protein LINPERPRIM_LOCUS384, partial [Linum perenne]